MRARWLALFALAPLTGCGLIYTVDAQQGNLFDKATVESLSPGMTKRQVLLVMGSPAVISPFNQDRWDYVSTIRRGRGEMESKDLVLHFENDALVKIDGDYFPENPDDLLKDARKYKRPYQEDAPRAKRNDSGEEGA